MLGRGFKRPAPAAAPIIKRLDLRHVRSIGSIDGFTLWTTLLIECPCRQGFCKRRRPQWLRHGLRGVD